MEGKPRIIGFCCLIFLFASKVASASVIETSLLAAMSKEDLGSGYSTEQTRYTASIAYKFTPVSAIELAYTYMLTTGSTPADIGIGASYITKEVVTFQDQVYSASWVQNVVPSDWLVQPYVKLGAGKLHRKQTVEFPEFGNKDEQIQIKITGVAGVGLRIFLTRFMAIKGEFTTYAPDFHFGQWKSNEASSVGLSWLF